jgi:hypothetical protein
MQRGQVGLFPNLESRLSCSDKGRDGGAGGFLRRLKILDGRRERTDNRICDRILSVSASAGGGRLIEIGLRSVK